MSARQFRFALNYNTTMYYYEKSFLNNKPCFIVIDPDGELNVFNTELDASFFVDYLNNLPESN